MVECVYTDFMDANKYFLLCVAKIASLPVSWVYNELGTMRVLAVRYSPRSNLTLNLMMPALSCPTMATTQESKSESTPSSTSTSYNTYNKSVAVSAAASIRNPSVLVSWILEHKSSPYPTKEEKKVLAKQAGMTITQVSYWFANTRRRIKKLGSWIVWEESQVHHKTPVVIPHLSLFPCSDPFSTNNILTADYSKPNPSGE